MGKGNKWVMSIFWLEIWKNVKTKNNIGPYVWTDKIKQSTISHPTYVPYIKLQVQSSFNFGGILPVHFQTKPIPTNSIHSGPPKNCNVTSITSFISIRPYISIKCFPIHYILAIIICFSMWFLLFNRSL